MRPLLLACLTTALACGRGAAPPPTATTTTPPPPTAPPASPCPADQAGPKVALVMSPSPCDDGAAACEDACAAGDGVACLLLAIDGPQDAAHAVPRYRRACELGVLAGCTNVAALMLSRDGDDAPATLACTARTFQLTCAGDDAWGCVMAADALLHGRGTARDLDAARAAVARACPLAQDDAVCPAAIRLAAEIDAARP